MSEEVKKEIVTKSYSLNDSGAMQLSTLDEQLAFAKTLMDQKMISETFKTPQQVVNAIQLCKALNLNPMTGLKMLYVVGGKACLYGDGPLSLVHSSGNLASIEEFYFNEKMERISFENKNLKDEVFGAYCKITRKGDPATYETFFTDEDRKKAMLNSPVWLKYKRDMLKYRARGSALKAKFADVLNGLEIAEFNYQDMPQNGIISNDAEKLKELNETFTDKG